MHKRPKIQTSNLQSANENCRAQIELSSVEVRFQDLSIDADIAVGARGEPTVLNAYRNTAEVVVVSLPTFVYNVQIQVLQSLAAATLS